MKAGQLFQRTQNILRDTGHICFKEFKSVILDEGVLLFFILVPLLYPVLYTWIYCNQFVREVPVAVVDMSHSHASRQFIRDFDAAPDVKVAYKCNNLAEAQELIGKEKVRGIIYFPSDFQSRISCNKQAPVRVYCDMNIMFYYKSVFQTATTVALKMGHHIQAHASEGFTSRDTELSTTPLKIEEVPLFNYNEGYGNFLIPAVLILILHQTLLLGIGLGAGTARENNRYGSLVPISPHYNGVLRIVCGKSFCYFLIYLLLSVYVALTVPKLFGVIQLVSVGTFLIMITPFLLATIFFGMTLSCIIRYRENVLLLIVFTSVLLLFLSGISWPLSNMPAPWRAIASLFPSTYGVRAFVRLNTMGASLADIRQEHYAQWIQAGIYFTTTCIVYRYQLRQARENAKEQIEGIKEKIDLARSNKK